jgi:hypothetical protein
MPVCGHAWLFGNPGGSYLALRTQCLAHRIHLPIHAAYRVPSVPYGASAPHRGLLDHRDLDIAGSSQDVDADVVGMPF